MYHSASSIHSSVTSIECNCWVMSIYILSIYAHLVMFSSSGGVSRSPVGRRVVDRKSRRLSRGHGVTSLPIERFERTTFSFLNVVAQLVQGIPSGE